MLLTYLKSTTFIYKHHFQELTSNQDYYTFLIPNRKKREKNNKYALIQGRLAFEIGQCVCVAKNYFICDN